MMTSRSKGNWEITDALTGTNLVAVTYGSEGYTKPTSSTETAS